MQIVNANTQQISMNDYEVSNDYEAILTSYLSIVIKNEAKNILASVNRKVNKMPIVTLEENPHLEFLAVGFDNTTEMVLERKELSPETVQNQKLSEILADATSEQVKLLNLFIDGYTDSEIAKMLGRARQTINRQKLRLLKSIEEALC